MQSPFNTPNMAFATSPTFLIASPPMSVTPVVPVLLMNSNGILVQSAVIFPQAALRANCMAPKVVPHCSATPTPTIAFSPGPHSPAIMRRKSDSNLRGRVPHKKIVRDLPPKAPKAPRAAAAPTAKDTRHPAQTPATDALDATITSAFGMTPEACVLKDPEIHNVKSLETTLNTTLEFTLTAEDLQELRDVAQQQDNDPTAKKTIEELRKERTDRSVRAKVLKLPQTLCVAMACVLDKSPDLMMELCMKERGNVMCHLVERLGGEQCFSMIKFALDNFMPFATNQSGCIALPRILTYAKPSQRDVFFEQAMDNLLTLCNHPFGNYVIKHFIATKEPSYFKQMVAYLVKEDRLQQTACNKFGSHVIDDILSNCSVETGRVLVTRVFSDLEVLNVLAHDSYANYCVQQSFRFLHEVDKDAEFLAFCVKQTEAVVATSQYKQNIMKHATTPPSTSTRKH